MKFCPDCKNMLYYIEETGGGSINLQCRNCSYKEPSSALVYEHTLRDNTSIRLEANPYLTEDPTLPRFKTIQCINKECPTQGGESDIVGLKTDTENVVWMYKCAICKTSWEQASRRS